MRLCGCVVVWLCDCMSVCLCGCCNERCRDMQESGLSPDEVSLSLAVEAIKGSHSPVLLPYLLAAMDE